MRAEITGERRLALALFRAVQAAFDRWGWAITMSNRTPANQHGRLLGHCEEGARTVTLYVKNHAKSDPLPRSLLHEQLHAVLRFGDDGSQANIAEERHVLALERLLWPRLTQKQLGRLRRLLKEAEWEEEPK